MNGFHLLLLLLSVVKMSGGLKFTSKYGGTKVKGTVGSSFQFNWSFTGEVSLISWGLARLDGNVLEQTLFKLLANGNPLSPSTPETYVGRVDGIANNSFVTFTLHNLNLDDEKLYGCMIRTKFGLSSFDSVKLVVESLPNITDISANQTVNEEKELTLNCTASGKPTPNTTWIKLTDNSVVTMPLTSIRRTDEGGYRCSAYNGVGNPATKEVFITVHYQPNITSVTPVTKQSWIGQRIQLTCVADGSPTPSITWKKPDGTELKKVTSAENTVDAHMKGDQDFGNYTCEASNIVGTGATRWVQLNQIKPPASPNLTLSDNDIGASSLVIQWAAPAHDGGSPITGYNLIVLRGDSVILNVTTRAAVKEYTLYRLNKSTTYTLRVSAINKVFQGAASEKKVTTKYEGAPATVEIIGLPTETRNVSVTIKWNEPENNGAPITQYTVYQRIVNNDNTVGEWNKIREVQDLPKRQVIFELDVGMVYEFVVTATNKHGESLRGGKNVRKLVVLGEKPEPIVFFTSEGKDGKVTLTWKEPKENGTDITHYTVYKRIANGGEWIKVVNITISSQKEYIVQLEEGKKYDLVVTATNKYGESSINKENIKTVDVPSGGTADSGVQKEPKGVSPAVIAGAAAVGVLLILGLIVLTIWRKRRKTPSETGSATAGLQSPYPDELEDRHSAVGAPSAAQQLQEGGPVPDVTYAQVDKSKKKTKAQVTDVYAQVDKSKKSKKKRNKQPDELEYAELDDFRPNTHPTRQASGATARPLFRAPVYEGTEYADITQFGVPQNEPTYDNMPRKKDVVYSNVESM